MFYIKLYFIEKEGDEEKFHELEEQAYVILRPNETSVVFTRGIITKKNYWIDTDKKRKRHAELPPLDQFETGALEYILEFSNEEYYNILPDALGGRKWEEIKWEVQKEPFSNYSYSVMRSSVFQLIDDEDLNYLKGVIVDGSKANKDPSFKKGQFIKENKELLEGLSKAQESAVIKSVQTLDYHLISGVEKSGKSKILETLLKYYRSTKLKVLVVGSKNEFIDALLIKAKKRDISFIRISNSPSQVNEEITDRVKTKSSFTTSEELDEMLKTENIYASTCLGCQNGILGLIKPFDVCIMTNAEYVKEPVALGALILAKKFIMCGTFDKESDKKTQDSLFKRLIGEHGDEMSYLEKSFEE